MCVMDYYEVTKCPSLCYNLVIINPNGLSRDKLRYFQLFHTLIFITGGRNELNNGIWAMEYIFFKNCVVEKCTILLHLPPTKAHHVY